MTAPSAKARIKTHKILHQALDLDKKEDKCPFRGSICDTPETATVFSIHFSVPIFLHCKTKLVSGVPPLTGKILREKWTEVGPGITAI